MDYFQPTVDKWTCCSNSDFENLYNTYDPFCLVQNSISGTTTTTTTTPTGECEKTHGVDPSWIGDTYCDDSHNNIECNYDGGDCCGNSKPTWDQYCSVCECLDPDYTTTTTTKKPSCKDKKKTKQCRKLKKKGRCGRKKVWKKCKKTCNKC